MILVRRIPWLLATFLLVAPVQLRAQDDPTFVPGDRVRVTAPTMGIDRLVGTLRAIDMNARALEIQKDPDFLWRRPTLTVPFDSVITLEVSRRDKSAQVRGAVLGAGLGAVVGGAIGSALGEDCAPQGLTPCFDKGSMTLIGAVTLGSAGALIGLLVTKRDRWEAVPLDALRVDLSTRSQGDISISATITL